MSNDGVSFGGIASIQLDDTDQDSKAKAPQGYFAKQLKMITDHFFAEESDVTECDPYVRVTLKREPQNSREKSTSVSESTEPVYGGGRNVKFDESHKNKMQFDMGDNSENVDFSLKISVFDEDLGKDDKIGTGILDLKDWDSSKQSEPLTVKIESGNGMFAGQVDFYLTVDHNSKLMTVVLIGARGLKTQAMSEDGEGNWMSFLWKMSKMLIWILLYAVVFHFTGALDEVDGYQGFKDAFYFSVVTTTTVGYGQYRPETPAGRYLNSVGMVFGTAILGGSLSSIFIFMTARREKFRRAKGKLEPKPVKNLKKMLLGFFMLLIVSVMFFWQYEGSNEKCLNAEWCQRFKDFDEAFHFCFVTFTTVGYGDIKPASDLGRAFNVFFILCGIGMLGQIASLAAEIMQVKKQVRKRKVVLSQGLSTVDEFEYFDADGEADGEIEPFEFLAKMVTFVGVCDEKLVDLIMERFAELDTDGSGILTLEDFTQRPPLILDKLPTDISTG